MLFVMVGHCQVWAIFKHKKKSAVPWVSENKCCNTLVQGWPEGPLERVRAHLRKKMYVMISNLWSIYVQWKYLGCIKLWMHYGQNWLSRGTLCAEICSFEHGIISNLCNMYEDKSWTYGCIMAKPSWADGLFVLKFLHFSLQARLSIFRLYFLLLSKLYEVCTMVTSRKS